jgi:hypothetical protein
MGGGECTRCRVQDLRLPGIHTDVVAFRAPSERSEMTSFQDEDMETRAEGQGGAEAPSDTDDQDDTDSTDDADSSDADTDSTDADTDSTDPS